MIIFLFVANGHHPVKGNRKRKVWYLIHKFILFTNMSGAPSWIDDF